MHIPGSTTALIARVPLAPPISLSHASHWPLGYSTHRNIIGYMSRTGTPGRADTTGRIDNGAGQLIIIDTNTLEAFCLTNKRNTLTAFLYQQILTKK